MTGSGFFTCANSRCGRTLDVDHVTMITTGHVRRFCSVECIHEGQEAADDAIWDEVTSELSAVSCPACGGFRRDEDEGGS